MTARKSNDVVAKNLLTTLLGELQTIEKNSLGGSIDENIILTTLRKFVKNAEQTRKTLFESNRSDQLMIIDREISILNSYLPQLMTESQLTKAIKQIQTHLNLSGPKSKGPVMSQLKTLYPNRYDARQATVLIDQT